MTTPNTPARSWNERLNNALTHLSTDTPYQGKFSPRNLEIEDKLKVLKHLLCVRQPEEPQLPAALLDDIDSILKYDAAHHLFTASASIPTICTHNTSGVRIHLWQGDITKLTDATAVVNAANEQLLGCFQPRHKCIDNVIHAAAGPRLRAACRELMHVENDDELEPVGCAKVTPGFCLAAEYVIHTVGPQLQQGSTTGPTEEERQDLARCYESCLDAAEKLPSLEADGRKVLVFCCISTGLFAFPQDMAAEIAVKTVYDTLDKNPVTSITDIIFDVFRDDDREIYAKLLKVPSTSLTPPAQQLSEPRPLVPAVNGPIFSTATKWLKEADTLIICAGAGLSAAAGLDYTSPALFDKHFKPFKKLGLSTLYSVFGFQRWPSLLHEWGYYFTHLDVVRNWPTAQIYKPLLRFAETFGQKYHVRTTNADGMFLMNGLAEDMLSTPQGRYEYLQCYKTCRPNATIPAKPYIEAALPLIDPETLLLTDESKVPRCPHCDGKVVICVRGGNYFNERPFAAGEQRWKEFLRNSVRNPDNKMTVVLELGVGMNTAGVLRWPNEQLVRTSRGTVKLIRVGLGVSGNMDWDIEEEGNAVGIPGDIATVLPYLLQSRLPTTTW